MAAKKKTQKKTKKRAVKPALRKPAAKRKPVVKYVSAREKRGKSPLNTDIVLAPHADETHAKQQAKPIHLVTPTGDVEGTLKPKSRKHRFSFPVALSQVRDRVSTVAATVRSENIEVRRERKPLMAKLSHSPYILDLKNRRTVVHKPSQRHLPRKAAQPMPQQEQGILSLFEDQQQSIVDSWRSKAAELRDHLHPVKTINFVPRHERMKSSFTARLARVFTRVAYVFSEPVIRWRHRRLQQTLALPESLVPASRGKPAFEITRAGQPISARAVSGWLNMRSLVEKPMASLSALTPTSLGESLSDWFRSVEWAKAAVSFLGLCALIALPMVGLSWFERVRHFQAEVIGATSLALNQLDSAKQQAGAMDFVSASKLFENAGQSFQAASALLKNQSPVVVKVMNAIPGVHTPVDDADNLLSAGQKLSDAAKSMSQGVSVFTDGTHFLADQPLSYKIEYFFVRLKEALPLLEDSQTLLGQVDVASIPADQRESLEQLKSSLPALVRQFHTLAEISDPLLTFLGHKTMQRHLVVFENNTELRATGGFMGSLALVDIDRGEIKKIEIPGGGPYDYQGSLTKQIQAPRALQLVSARWELQDANWFFDWPTSAAKISYLYDQAGGPTVDSVIAVDTNVLEELLRVLGPVKLAAYGKEISAENFRDILQQQVEVEYDKQLNQPKKIIADLSPVLLERLKAMPVQDAVKLAPVFVGLLQQRDVLLSHHDPEVMRVFSVVGWSGEVEPTDGDYLAVVHTNIAGGKTDGVIKDHFDLSVTVDERSEMTHTLTIRREHAGVKGTAFNGVRNVDYVRVYVPENSTLISATGFSAPPKSMFEQPDANWMVDADLKNSQDSYRVHPESSTEIYQESGKTVFANWIQVDPGQTAEVKLVYRTPVNLKIHEIPQRDESWTDWVTGNTVKTDRVARLYHLYWQKQPGSWDPDIHFEMNYPSTWRVETTDQGDQTAGHFSAQSAMQTDLGWGLLFF